MNEGPHEVRLAKAKAMVGKRIEIPVHYDMWMRGARYGVVRSAAASGDYVKVLLDHTSAKKKQLKVWAIDYDYVKVLPSMSNDDDPAAPLHETGGQVLERVDSSTMRWDSSNGEHPIYGRADWRAEVAQDNTILGYEEWVAHQIEAENDA